MRIGYLDCSCGVSGDMMLGALVDAGLPLQALREALRGLPLDGWELQAERVRRGGLAATKVDVILADHPHEHRGLGDVLEVIAAGGLPEPVAARAGAVFRALAEAEARVHGTDVESVHFHEVGAVDAICDVVGAVVGLQELGVERLLFSTVAVGGGVVRMAHGTLPVPAPASEELLKGLPTVGGPVDVELATPTGAALLRVLGRPAPVRPPMRVELVGCGAGRREIEGAPNVLRLSVGEGLAVGEGADHDSVWMVETNLDDMTGEEVGYLLERLMAAGALDAWTVPAQMKKGRPGVVLSALAAPDGREAVEAVLWRESSTFGVRRRLTERAILARRTETVQTPWGEVRVKVGLLGGQVVRREPEYEDCRRLAESSGVALREVHLAARRAGEETA